MGATIIIPSESIIIGEASISTILGIEVGSKTDPTKTIKSGVLTSLSRVFLEGGLIIRHYLARQTWLQYSKPILKICLFLRSG
ncbi:hypothetical protein M6B38_352335 [Iris pallida]|uniref:Uncharacterized protein n=1 Tax=Iris pallida TaxID=29817 RepID=A0AAX6FSE2_IRIPA|nr:hypothetical protein M6B38_402605 [Iris pallida]KAJ6830824.1 hypothetical protein M6B38_352335 [Iris pallida]